jgi:HEAT repeat protein
VRALAANQLLMSGAPEGIALAGELINGSDKELATQAIWSLSNSRTPEANRLLEGALSSTNASVRAAAVSVLGQHGDAASTDKLIALTRDNDPSVRGAALSALGQVGGDRAQQAIFDAARSGKAEDRIAAISSLGSRDDDRSSKMLADLIKDRDPQVAQAAINSAYNGGDEVDQSLISLINATNSSAELRASAANQLRSRGADLDERTEKAVTELAGPPQIYGGYGYGGGYGGRYMD